MLEIRLAQFIDSTAIAELHAQSWRHAYRSALSDSYLSGDIVADRLKLWNARLSEPSVSQNVLVGYRGSELLAFACAYTHESREFGSLLDNIHVKPASHRQGFGTSMLRAISRQLEEKSPSSPLYLWVLQNNTNAQRFYQSFGATNIGSDIWHAPDGTKVPRYRFGRPSGELPFTKTGAVRIDT